jgi:hypothetical protein
MIFLERILNWKSAHALLDIVLGPEVESRKKSEQIERPRSKKAQ